MYYGYAYYCNGTTFAPQKYSKQYNKRISLYCLEGRQTHIIRS